MEQRPVNVIGHKNPDTDSVCSAIAYAYLKNVEQPNHYIARRAGKINNETKFVLDYFSIPAPDYLEDVNVQMRDIDFRETKGVADTISIRTAWQLMKEQDVVTLPITQGGNKLEGLITINDIAKSYMDVFDNRILALARTPVSNLIEVLEGTLVCGNPHARIVNGKVLIGAANIDVMEACVEEDDVVLVADRKEVQQEAIEQGASCLIICLNADISPDIIQMAQEHQCNIISTSYDTYSAARMMNQCIPIKYFMRRSNLVTFQLDDTLDSVKEVMSKLRHRDFPITDDVGNYYGMVSRRNLLAMRRKQVILVDHNERSQAVTGIENADILEIIDHHRIGSLETIQPVYFRNQPVGCTATIIYQMFTEQHVTPPKEIAGLLCSAILSDTLMFRSPTCTPMDESAVRQLSKIADIDIETYAMKMFAAGSDLAGKTPEEIFYQDFKTFHVGDITFGVGQISSMNREELADLQTDIHAYLKDAYAATKCDMMFFALTNILDESSDLLYYGDQAESLVREAFETEPNGTVCHLTGVVSRKKQIVPVLVSTLQQWDN